MRRVMVALAVLAAGCPSSSAPPGATGFVLPPTKVIVVRHAESVKNVPHADGLTEDQLNELTDKGKKDFDVVAYAINVDPIGALLVSPTGRTRATAAMITSYTHRQPTESAALGPLKEGTASGKPTTFDWHVEAWARGQDPRPEGGESLGDVAARAVAAVRELAKAHPAETVVIVTHGEVAAALLGEADKTPVHERWAKHQLKTGTSRIVTVAADGTLGLVSNK